MMTKMVNHSGNVIFVAKDRVNEYASAGYRPADFITQIDLKKPEKTLDEVNEELKATVKRATKRTKK
ncbi:MAG: hypothetical protein K6B14_07445 [Lachnospiraceae bacterium]|nr:hypothetical protein [Lachnospiraceae bacterium]